MSDNSSTKKLVVVLGVTGRQGHAVARNLLKTGSFAVRGVSRTPDSAEAKAVAAALGIELIKADAQSKQSLVEAFSGAHGVFAITNPFTKRWSPRSLLDTNVEQGSTEGETLQGKNIVDACRQCGVSHLVFSSVAHALDKTGVPTFEAKADVERYIDAVGAKGMTTVLGPVGFFENMVGPFGIKQGTMPSLIGKGKRSQLIACDDIGFFATLAFTSPGEWKGVRLDIAGDELTAEEQAAVLSKLRGGEPWVVSMPPEWVFKLFIPKAVGTLRTFLQEKGCHVDIPKVRALHPQLATWEDFCVAQGLQTKTLPQPSYCAVM